MKNFRSIRHSLPLLVLLLGSLSRPVQAQLPAAAQLEARAYDFLGYYFQAVAQEPGREYRLAAPLLPLVSPYADHFDLRQALSADYLKNNQFSTTVEVDTLLTEADFAAMREQLVFWEGTHQWRMSRLRAHHIAVLRHDRRTSAQRLFPKFTTYQTFPPLFSRSGQLALFYLENYCGVDCAGGQISLLRRQPDGTWQRILSCLVFIS